MTLYFNARREYNGSMKKHITDLITEYVRERNEGLWRDPLVGFADARNELAFNTNSDHWIAVSYFIPYSVTANAMNRTEVTASAEWIDAYHRTEQLIGDIDDIKSNLEEYCNYLRRKDRVCSIDTAEIYELYEIENLINM